MRRRSCLLILVASTPCAAHHGVAPHHDENKSEYCVRSHRDAEPYDCKPGYQQ